MLARDQPGHRFEDFRRPHHGPCLELPGRDRALARGARHADQVLGRVFEIRHAAKCAGCRHDDVGGHRRVEHHMSGSRLAACDSQLAANGREVYQLEGQDGGSERDVLEAICSGSIRQRRELPRAAFQVHRYP